MKQIKQKVLVSAAVLSACSLAAATRLELQAEEVNEPVLQEREPSPFELEEEISNTQEETPEAEEETPAEGEEIPEEAPEEGEGAPEEGEGAPEEGEETPEEGEETPEEGQGEEEESKEYLFDDVDPESKAWYVKYVYEAAKLGLMTGVDETTFAPDETMTRGMAATVFHRISDCPEVEFENLFEDVSDGLYYSQAVIWCSQNNIMTGYGEQGGFLFGVNDNITREQFATALYRYAHFLGLDLCNDQVMTRYADLENVSPYAKEAVSWAVYQGIMQGSDNLTKLNPTKDAIRAECAKLFVGFSQIYTDGELQVPAGLYLLPDGNVVFYSSEQETIGGLLTCQNKTYYFDPENSNYMAYGLVDVPGNNEGDPARRMFFGTDGARRTGFQKTEEGYMYFNNEDGVLFTNGFKDLTKKESLSGKKSVVYFGSDGKLVLSKFTIGNSTYTPNAETGNIEKVTVDGVVYLKQTDSRWSSVYFNGYSMGSTGCVASSLAMAINTLKGTSYTPLDVANVLYDAGLFNTEYLGAAAEGVIYAANYFGLKIQSMGSAADMNAALQKGAVIVGAMNPGLFTVEGSTHEIFMYGYENGKTNVLDPYWPEHNGLYSTSTIYDERATDYLDCEYGGPIFALSL